jgi:broad specificity phosphatase PhoE
LERICAGHRSPRSAVACFSHADIIKLAVAHYLGLPLDLFQRLAVEPASITVVHVTEGRALVVRLNDARVQEMVGSG